MKNNNGPGLVTYMANNNGLGPGYQHDPTIIMGPGLVTRMTLQYSGLGPGYPHDPTI
jgi:hypothetical protein